MAADKFPGRSWQLVKKGKHGTVESSARDNGNTMYRIVWKKQVDHTAEAMYVGLGMKKGAACDLALRLAEEGHECLITL